LRHWWRRGAPSRFAIDVLWQKEGPMTTATPTLVATPGWRRVLPRAGAILLAAAAAVLAVKFVAQNAVRFVHWDAAHYGRYWGMRGWIALHVLGGLVALACGPFQLWSGLRGRDPAWHRLRGRVYAMAVLVGSIGGVWIAVTSPLFPGFAPALIMLAAAWLTTTGLAWAAIVRGDVALHKELMIRSYVVTFAFVCFRFLADLPVLTHMAPPDRYVAIAWLCWTLPLLVTELILQGRRIVRAAPAAGVV
jgi:uncharacterized membrane protein